MQHAERIECVALLAMHLSGDDEQEYTKVSIELWTCTDEQLHQLAWYLAIRQSPMVNTVPSNVRI